MFVIVVAFDCSSIQRRGREIKKTRETTGTHKGWESQAKILCHLPNPKNKRTFIKIFDLPSKRTRHGKGRLTRPNNKKNPRKTRDTVHLPATHTFDYDYDYYYYYDYYYFFFHML